MPSQPYLRSLSIEHFRGIVKLDMPHLRRVTLLGGLNGSGKSTVLDVIFQFIDTNNPALLIRSGQFRQTPVSLKDIHRINDGANERAPSIHKFKTRDGDYTATWQWGPQNLGQTVQSVQVGGNIESQTSFSQEGYELSMTRNGTIVLDRKYVGDAPESMMMKQDVALQLKFPLAAYLSRHTIGNVNDLATRYTQIVQSGLKKRLLKIINTLSVQFDDIELLHIANQPVIHLTLNGVLIPLAFAGDGITTVAAISLAIMISSGGVVIIDEFDASVHYSRLKQTWALFHQLCLEFDCQLVVATHSRESAEALFDAVDAAHANDVIYYRLDLVDGKNIATSYSWEEMREAQAEGWEFR